MRNSIQLGAEFVYTAAQNFAENRLVSGNLDIKPDQRTDTVTRSEKDSVK